MTIAIVACVAFGAFLVNLALEQKNRGEPSGRGELVRLDAAIPVSKVTNFPLPSAADVTDRVQKVLAIRDAAEFGDDIRLKDLSEEDVLRILEELRAYGGGVSKVVPVGPFDTNDLQIQGAQVVFNKETARQCLVMLTPDSSGHWQVDVGSLVAKGDVEWDEYRGTNDVEGVFRATVKRDHYFNGEFADDRKWQSYRLSHPLSNHVVVGYCEKGSPMDEALISILATRAEARVIVRLKTASVSRGTSQAAILSVLANEWILTNTPYDEGFRKPLSSEPENEEELQPL